jgi:O-antigen/teichoic acid export membrane protein
MKKIIAVSNNLNAKLIAMVFFYLQDIVLARILGVDEYAEWAYFFSLMTIMFWISSLGISNAIQVITAKDDGDKHKIDIHIKSGLLLRIVVSAIFVILILLISKPVCLITGLEEKYSHLSRLLVIGTGYLFFYSLVEFWKNAYIGLKRSDKLLIVSVFEHAGYFLWSIIGYCFLKNIYGVIVGYVISYAVAFIVSGKLYIKEYSSICTISRNEVQKNMQKIFKLASTYIIACLSAFIMLEMDTVMLGSMQNNKAELAMYVVAKKLTSKAPSLNEALLLALMVEFAVINSKNYIEKKKLFKKVFLINGLITVGVAAALVLFGKLAITILYGNEYVYSYRYLLILNLNYIITGINHMFIYFLYYQECAGYVSITYAFSVICNLVLNAVLIPNYGAAGAGWATVISMLPFIVSLGIKCMKIWERF